MDAAQGSSVKRLWPVWVSLGLPLLLVALNSTPIATDFAFVIIGIPVLLGIWACFGIWALILPFDICDAVNGRVHWPAPSSLWSYLAQACGSGGLSISAT